ncbi:hypothetical protein CCHR01_08633 [Colletotrichum chrysophilum]|uniref:Uncharacterized protein n=1 Tax=Colletotrichum chrysophilum TaxID=1836956 RepID=A0AAD9AIJ6_9PEZI|nr:hypothetical protein K456DRAFT_258295 [Colletotrichum gloeosporioides 23]KAK1848728.1 hypothetical protein CCHR01_08633 [Colletotrichum chrysophilum]
MLLAAGCYLSYFTRSTCCRGRYFAAASRAFSPPTQVAHCCLRACFPTCNSHLGALPFPSLPTCPPAPAPAPSLPPLPPLPIFYPPLPFPISPLHIRGTSQPIPLFSLSRLSCSWSFNPVATIPSSHRPPNG